MKSSQYLSRFKIAPQTKEQGLATEIYESFRHRVPFVRIGSHQPDGMAGDLRGVGREHGGRREKSAGTFFVEVGAERQGGEVRVNRLT